MSGYVVVGTSAFHDTSIACGPYRTFERGRLIAERLTLKGWNTEVIEMCAESEVDAPVNDEGKEES